jgi:hypothetical protein
VKPAPEGRLLDFGHAGPDDLPNGSGGRMARHRIYSISVASVYPHYIAKAEKKGRTKAEVDEIIRWLTGHSQQSLDAELAKKTSFEDFFAQAPRLNPNRSLIKGVVCGVRVEDIEEPLMRELRYLDKLIDELARGKPMEKILRKDQAGT